MPFDTSLLRRASGVDGFPWRWGLLTLIRLSADGAVTQAKRITEKRELLEAASPNDCVLAAWPGEYSQDIFVVDDLPAALAGLDPPARSHGP